MCTKPRDFEMPDDPESENGTFLNSVDTRGRAISPPVRQAAESISRRAIQHAVRIFIDSAVAANLLEEAAASVSRALKKKEAQGETVRDLESYLFRAFLRRLNRAKKSQLRLSAAIASSSGSSGISWDPRNSLERKIFLDEFLARCDEDMHDVLSRRIAGFSWKEIADAHHTSPHAAESKFSQALQRIRRKLGLK